MPTRTEIKEIEEIRDPYPKDFAGRLRAFRKKLKIKQTEFAEMLHIDIQKCRRYESIGTEPDVETLKKMASILKITVDELVGYKPAAINIATDILDKSGIVFKKVEDEDAYILYRYKTDDEIGHPDLNDLPYFVCFSKENNILSPADALLSVKDSRTDDLCIFFGPERSEDNKIDINEFLNYIVETKLSTAELKICVFEAKRRTDSIIKTALNETYAAFYPTVFRNYVNDEKYSISSVEIRDILPEIFPERLRALREGCHFSQSEMADEVGLSLQTYNRYETKNAQPSIDMLKRLALKLGVSVNVLTGFKLDYLNEALFFLEKVHIKCSLDKETQLYYVEAPDKENAKKLNAKALHFCTYQAKHDVDLKIKDDLKNIFDETFTPIFWELVNNHQNLKLDTIIDENDYEPYLYELDLMNKPVFSEKDTNEDPDD